MEKNKRGFFFAGNQYRNVSLKKYDKLFDIAQNTMVLGVCQCIWVL